MAPKTRRRSSERGRPVTFGEIQNEYPRHLMYEFPCIVCGSQTTQICNLCCESVCRWERIRDTSFVEVPVACYNEHRAKCERR